MSNALLRQRTRASAVLVGSSIGVYSLAIVLGIIWLGLHTVAAVQVAAPARYLADLLALVFLISTSGLGWKPWAVVALAIVMTRAMWFAAKLQHWGSADLIELVLYCGVFVLYGIRFLRKEHRRRLDYLKLLWVWVSCGIVVLNLLQVSSSLRFMVALGLSGLLQFLLWRQWKALPELAGSLQDWDFDQRTVQARKP